MNTESKKDWLGDIIITSFIVSFVGFMLGGLLGIRWLLWIGVLALIPLTIFFLGAMILRFFTMIAEVIEGFKKR